MDLHVVTDPDQIVKTYRPQYKLQGFRPIIAELLQSLGALTNLQDRDILELGPGTNPELLRFLKKEIGPRSVQGVGKTVIYPWTRHKQFIRANIVDQYILDFFNGAGSQSYDLIYSRHVMEQHSIHPWLLLTHKEYRQAIKNNSFNNLSSRYPSSPENIQAIFRECYRCLKPGGIMVALIGKHKYHCFPDDFLKKFSFHGIRASPLGKISCIMTFAKPVKG